MISLAFWTVAGLVAWKAVPELRFPAPWEWVGELAAGLLAFLIAGIVAVFLTLHLGTPPAAVYPPPPFSTPGGPPVVPASFA